MRKSDIFLFSCVALILFLGVLFGHGAWRVAHDGSALDARKALVTYLTVSDLCLFTDARYMRHISQTDIHAPFQDHPVALDYFPSGSLVSPPDMLRKLHE